MSLRHMTWKSTAASVGLAAVATWLASHAPAGNARTPVAAPPSATHTEKTAAEIQRQADRLHARLQQVAAYRSPARNPFRFGAPVAKAPSHAAAVSSTEAPTPVIDPQPPSLRILLSGVAEEKAGEDIVRTAIISTPTDVYLVKIGETIQNTYKVTNITADAVELVRIEDGSTVTLVLRNF
jgi:hypothetical protein